MVGAILAALGARFGTAGSSRWAFLRDLNVAAASAGLTTFIWYAVGMVPVQIAATGQFGLDAAQVSSWIFIIWTTGAISSIVLSLVYRQPIPITSTIPGLLFMATLAGSYSYPELVGANLLAGLVILALGLFRVGGRILDWLPMPLAMGMLGGSILGDVTRAVTATVGDAVVAGATVVGYLLGRTIRSQRVPPVAIALVSGALAVVATQRLAPVPVAWQMPSLVIPTMEFSLSSFIAVSLPMVVLSMGLGNVQGLGFLRGQGYRVPANVVTFTLGLNSIVNAFFGGHAAIVSRNGMPIMASSEAGPVSGRYWANLISAGLTLLIAVAAQPVASLLGILPMSYIVALAGVAILPSFQNAVEQAFSGKMRFGAVVAFVIACTPFSLFGISSPFWALVAGVIASLVAERADLLDHWRRTEPADQRREPRVPVEVRPSAAHRIAGRRRTSVTVTLRNLSASGLSARSDHPLFPGDQLELAFQLPSGGIDVHLRADVRHVEHIHDGPVDLWEAGCEFRSGEDGRGERVVALILEHQESFAATSAAPAEPASAGATPESVIAWGGIARRPYDLEVDLRRAIDGDELAVHYQPIVSLESMGITEVEAFVRWDHPERGIVEPRWFLPIAEQTGLTVPLGRWVLERACRQVREWQALHAGPAPLILGVNLSACQLEHPDLVDDVAQALWNSQLDPATLSLEITESGLIDDPDAAMETMQRLKRLGIRLVLDDFGSGPSSLKRLACMPLDALKIDPTWIGDLGSDGPESMMVRSVISVARSIGLTVTAEGVETWSQATLLRQLGCQQGQGYFFARPQPSDAIETLLSSPVFLHGPARTKGAA